MTAPFPPIEPYDHGMLDTGDGNLVYWEACGNPRGKPALVVHGGPGSGCSAGPRKAFDPERYRIILFDQRNCGRSLPHASDPAADMALNTTEHLLRDMESLREHLGVERWLLFGGSWGTTLSLAYAERHPERVSELVLVSITTARRVELDWLYRGVGRFFPAEWRRFRSGAPLAGDDSALPAAYARLMEDPDPRVRGRAALDWRTWEDTVLSLEPGGGSALPAETASDAMLAFVRICAHYYANAAWLEEDALLRDAHRLAGIPGVLIHGRQDLSCPLETAWQLSQAWPGSELVMVDDSGHKGSALMNRQVYAAIGRFADH
jgi:proline iminopeptidase